MLNYSWTIWNISLTPCRQNIVLQRHFSYTAHSCVFRLIHNCSPILFCHEKQEKPCFCSIASPVEIKLMWNVSFVLYSPWKKRFINAGSKHSWCGVIQSFLSHTDFLYDSQTNFFSLLGILLILISFNQRLNLWAQTQLRNRLTQFYSFSPVALEQTFYLFSCKQPPQMLHHHPHIVRMLTGKAIRIEVEGQSCHLGSGHWLQQVCCCQWHFLRIRAAWCCWFQHVTCVTDSNAATKSKQKTVTMKTLQKGTKFYFLGLTRKLTRSIDCFVFDVHDSFSWH